MVWGGRGNGDGGAGMGSRPGAPKTEKEPGSMETLRIWVAAAPEPQPQEEEAQARRPSLSSHTLMSLSLSLVPSFLLSLALPPVSALAASAVACRGSLTQAASTPLSSNQPSSDMEKETELLPPRKSSENGVMQLKPLQPLPIGKVALFKLPQVQNNNGVEEEDDDDDDDAISLKEWQPSPRSPTVDTTGTSYSAWKPVREKSDTSSNGNEAAVKGSVRLRPVGYTALVESNGDVCLPTSIHSITLPAHKPSEVEDDDDDDDAQDDDQANGTYEDGLDDDLEDEDEAQLTEPDEAEQHRPKAAHHQHSISLVNGIAPPPSHPTGGVAFDIALDDHYDNQPRRSTGSSRGSSLRVSFINDVVLDSPSPPRNGSKSPFRPRNGTKSPSQSTTNGKPGWDSSAKIGKSAPPMPKKFVRPTLHGIKVKKGQGGVAKTAMRASTTALETGFAARDGRPKVQAVARSWDAQYVGGEYDSVSQLISKSLALDESNRKDDSARPARLFVPRSNGDLKAHGDHEGQNGSEEVIKPKYVASNGTNKSTGDFSKLFSKLRRASAPLSKPPSKSQPAANPKPAPAPPVITKMPRANSVPVESQKPGKKSLAPLHSLDSSGANQKYAIGSYASLKLLQECAQTEKSGPTPAFNVHKPRKIRDHEPHRHYYKTISKTLDSKLK